MISILTRRLAPSESSRDAKLLRVCANQLWFVDSTLLDSWRHIPRPARPAQRSCRRKEYLAHTEPDMGKLSFSRPPQQSVNGRSRAIRGASFEVRKIAVEFESCDKALLNEKPSSHAERPKRLQKGIFVLPAFGTNLKSVSAFADECPYERYLTFFSHGRRHNASRRCRPPRNRADDEHSRQSSSNIGH